MQARIPSYTTFIKPMINYAYPYQLDCAFGDSCTIMLLSYLFKKFVIIAIIIFIIFLYFLISYINKVLFSDKPYD